MAEAELLSGHLQCDLPCHGDEALAHPASPQHEVRCVLVSKAISSHQALLYATVSLTKRDLDRALAAGFLTGKFVNGQHAGTRLGDENPLGKKMQQMYGQEELLAAVKKFDTETRALGLTPLEVSIQWIFHHSKLRDDDCVLLGASKVEQIVENVTSIKKGPLPEKVCLLVEELWESVRDIRGKVM
jgi:hypothetical protein